MDRILIITRHAGAAEWLRQRGVVGDVIPHVADPATVRGAIVVGVVPLHIACEAREVWAIDLPRLPPELRGKELTPDEMDSAGATLVKYKVTRV